MERFMDLIYYTANGLNGFDSLGHYLRALLLVTNCVDYRVTPLSGCDANWASETLERRAEVERPAAEGAAQRRRGGRARDPARRDERDPAARPSAGARGSRGAGEPRRPDRASHHRAADDAPTRRPRAMRTGEGEATGEQALRTRMRAARTLLDFLMENGA